LDLVETLDTMVDGQVAAAVEALFLIVHIR
jgi:hypothetical protein